MFELKSCPITIRPCKPFWRDEDGQWWMLSWGISDPENQIEGMDPFCPFDLIAAVWTFFRWRLSAEMRLRWARLVCGDEGHIVDSLRFYTRIGVYRRDECQRCGDFLGYFRPDGDRVPSNQSWCAEGHVINYILRVGVDGVSRCVDCGEAVA